MCLWLCTASVHNATQNSSDNLPTYLQTNIIAQLLSIGGEGVSVDDLELLLHLLHVESCWDVLYLASVPVSLWRLFVNDVLDREKLELDVRSRLLFTYRKGFKTIGELCDVWRMFIAVSCLLWFYLYFVHADGFINVYNMQPSNRHVTTFLIVFTHGLCEWVGRFEPVTLQKTPSGDHTPPGLRTFSMTCSPLTWGFWRQEMHFKIDFPGGCWLPQICTILSRYRTAYLSHMFIMLPPTS